MINLYKDLNEEELKNRKAIWENQLANCKPYKARLDQCKQELKKIDKELESRLTAKEIV